VLSIVLIATVVARHSSEKTVLASVATTPEAALAVGSTAPVVPAIVQVSAAALVNYSATDVATLLTAQGLVVEQSTVDAPGTPAGFVVGVTPEGAVPAGSTVTLSVSSGAPAAAPAPAATSNGKPKGGNGKGNGRG
jgi:beta-lactam-binding protein with PASTA domain